MKKNTARLIIAAVIVMIILNGILISLWWSNQSQRKIEPRPTITIINEFIIQEMGFDEHASTEFIAFAERHHHNQMQLQRRYRDIKGRLNMAMLNQHRNEADTLINELSDVVKNKELELYRFFSDVMSISNEDQRNKFGRIFREATGAPEYGRLPLGNSPNHRPPPKH